ncbi:MAG: SMC-Scp complex subunit ScpB [Planctomycetia bacterium]|nr:SMC-Scp complex subunit ScpB [Planctomycetia bacterium]
MAKRKPKQTPDDRLKQSDPSTSDESATVASSLGMPATKPAEADDEGLSLDSLSAAFAEMLGKGSDPYEEAAEPPPPADDPVAALAEELPRAAATDQDDRCEISPRTILEAMLFVGDPDNVPISPQWLAGLMRGVRVAEIEAAVRELNEKYLERNAPYEIISEGSGYRLVLRAELRSVRDKTFSRNRAAKLSQAAIETLSVVAYKGALTAEEVSNLRGHPSSAILNQLLRRQLLRMERPEGTSRKEAKFVTTKRFLELFGLESLDDLPRGQDVAGG